MQTKFNIGDHVKILDGNKIENYFGGWAPTMDFTIGKIVTIDKIGIGKTVSVTLQKKFLSRLMREDLSLPMMPNQLNPTTIFYSSLQYLPA